MEKSDPHGDWVLFQAKKGEGESSAPPDDELIFAGRVAHASRSAPSPLFTEEYTPERFSGVPRR